MSEEAENPWRRPLEHPALGEREIHIWRAALDVSPAEMERMRDMLSTEEDRQAERFLTQAPRRRFIVARGILRLLLGRYLDLSPRSIAFVHGPHGKPYLAPGCPLDISFNISHSAAIALFAFARDREVGIDVEQVRSDVEIEQLAERFYSPRESSAILALPPDLRNDAFFTCWVRKEAFLKAVGKGIAYGLDRVEVFRSPLEPLPARVELKVPDDPSPWRVLTLHPGAGFKGALVTRGEDWEEVLWEFG